MKKICIFVYAFFFVAISHSNTLLYPDEQIMDFAGAETLTYFQKGNPDKPLVIFIPGDSHLARVAYGFPQGQSKDFLAYWVHKRGYSFLGLSYPLANPVYSKKYPGFTISQWGEQIAQTANYFIEKNKLSKRIVVLGWSMGGSVEQEVYQHAQKLGLDMELFIGLAAVPPLPFIMQSGPFDTSIMGKDGLATREQLIPWFSDQLQKQNQLNKHTIIPDSIYRKEFIGNIPTALSAEGYFLTEGSFKKNLEKAYQDSDVFDFTNTPWIALIVDDAIEDAKISLIVPFSWNFIRAEMIYQRYLKKGIKSNNWTNIQTLVNNLPQQLMARVHGTHFFFVGELGAKDTAKEMELLIDKVRVLKYELEQGTK